MFLVLEVFFCLILFLIFPWALILGLIGSWTLGIFGAGAGVMLGLCIQAWVSEYQEKQAFKTPQVDLNKLDANL